MTGKLSILPSIVSFLYQVSSLTPFSTQRPKLIVPAAHAHDSKSMKDAATSLALAVHGRRASIHDDRIIIEMTLEYQELWSSNQPPPANQVGPTTSVGHDSTIAGANSEIMSETPASHQTESEATCRQVQPAEQEYQVELMSETDLSGQMDHAVRTEQTKRTKADQMERAQAAELAEREDHALLLEKQDAWDFGAVDGESGRNRVVSLTDTIGSRTTLNDRRAQARTIEI